MGAVNINLTTGQLGASLQTNDGIVGMVLTGTMEGAYDLGTPITVNSLADFIGHGLTATGNPFAYKQVSEFYAEVEAQGGTTATLYLMLVANTMSVAQMADKTNADGAKKLLDFAAGKIKVLAVCSDDTAVTAPTYVHGLNQDCYTAVTNMQALCTAYAQAQMPLRGIVGATSFQGVAGDLTDMTNLTANNRVAMLLADTATGVNACIGLLLGRIASIPVERKISRVRSNALSNTSAFIGTVALETFGTTNIGTIGNKGYITFMTYPNVAGYFWNGDSMCTVTTDDYQFLCRGRVIDKAAILAYNTFVKEVDDDVPLNADGTIDAGYALWLSNSIETAINETMKANKEISGVKCFIDATQNIVSTNQLNVVLKVQPVAYATDIEVMLGFAVSL